MRFVDKSTLLVLHLMETAFIKEEVNMKENPFFMVN
jgi:hypothetical protein